MRNRLLIGCLIIFLAAPGPAALRFGLGGAVAKRSADLINQAGAVSNPTGDNVAVTLPACPAGAVFDTLPIPLDDVRAFDPLGHVAPSPHTFPSDHLNIYRSTSASSALPIYAPGAMHISFISSQEGISPPPGYVDYSITFFPCKNIRATFGHVKIINPALLSQVGSIDQNCFTYSTGGGTVRSCEKAVNIVVQSGDLLGYTSTTGALDFGSYDYRITPLAFVASRHGPNTPYTVCPIDYFTDGPKATMEAKLGRSDGGHPRTTLPLCGQIMYDVAGAAKGDWYHPGSPDEPEDPHLALVEDNVYAPEQTISVGTSLPNLAPANFTFVPASSGNVDLDFALVKDNAIYCYDTFYDPLGQLEADKTFLIQLASPTTLRIEKQDPATCGAGPWSFTSNSVDFQR